VSVAIAALSSPTLNTAETDAQTAALRAIVDHHDDLVKTRTQTINRLHMVLTHLVPGGAGRKLGADHAAQLLHGLRARDAALPISVGPILAQLDHRRGERPAGEGEDQHREDQEKYAAAGDEYVQGKSSDECCQHRYQDAELAWHSCLQPAVRCWLGHPAPPIELLAQIPER